MARKKKLKGYLINLKDGTSHEVEFDDELETLYQLTNCKCIDVAERKVGKFVYDIVVDDEGLLVERPICTAFNSKSEPMLFGNLLFVNHDREGNFTSLKEEQIEDLQKHVGRYLYDDGNWVQNVPCVINCEYC